MSFKQTSTLIAFTVLGAQFNPLFAQDVNTPPRLVTNVNTPVPLGTETIVTQNQLRTTDAETTDPSEITYTLFPDDSTATFNPNEGLFLGSSQLKGRSTFTQADINAGRLRYRSPAVTDSPGLKIPFNVKDFEGALARDGAFTVFSMSFEYINQAPVAQTVNLETALGGTSTGFLVAANPETYQQLSYSITSQPSKGSVQLLNTNTGEFRYTARVGESGQDTFAFQVSDGFLSSVNPGTVSITISNQAPIVPEQSFSVVQNSVLNATIATTDSDLPEQRVSLVFVSGPRKGVVESFESNGRFTYNPNPGRFGVDSFVVAPTDGLRTGEPRTITIQIKPFPHDGTVLMTGRDTRGTQTENDDVGGLFLVNPSTGDAAQIVEGDFLREALALTYDLRRNEVFFAAQQETNKFVGGFNLGTGELRPISFNHPLLEFPLWLTQDKNHNLLLANGPGGILSVDANNGNISLVPNSKTGVVTSFQQNDDGTYLVLDAQELFADDSQLYILNPATGARDLVSNDPRFLDLVDVLTLPNGERLLAARGGIFRVNLATKEVVRVMDANAFNMLPKSMVMLADGQVLISDLFNKLILLNPSTGQFSTVTLDLALSPGGLAVIEQPSTWANWLSAYFTPAELGDQSKKATIWGADADPDSDGFSNYAEFAVGSHPLINQNIRPLTIRIGKSERGTFPWISYPVRKGQNGLTYTLQASKNLRDWQQVTGTFIDAEELGSSLQQVTYEITNSELITGATFYRLQITPPAGLDL